MKFVGFFSEVCWISQLSMLDFSVKFVGFLSELCWISQRFFVGFLRKICWISHYPQANRLSMCKVQFDDDDAL